MKNFVFTGASHMTQWYLALTLTLSSSFLIPTTAGADVQSRPCPFDCDTQKIPRSQCKDWREGTTCFVEDLRPGSSGGQKGASETSDKNRMVVSINKEVRAGQKTEIKLKKPPVKRIDVVVRRTDPSRTETKLAASLEDGEVLGSAQQVERDNSHVISFPAGLPEPRRRKLLLTAVDGSVFIESIHVIYK